MMDWIITFIECIWTTVWIGIYIVAGYALIAMIQKIIKLVSRYLDSKRLKRGRH